MAISNYQPRKFSVHWRSIMKSLWYFLVNENYEKKIAKKHGNFSLPIIWHKKIKSEQKNFELSNETKKMYKSYAVKAL